MCDARLLYACISCFKELIALLTNGPSSEKLSTTTSNSFGPTLGARAASVSAATRDDSLKRSERTSSAELRIPSCGSPNTSPSMARVSVGEGSSVKPDGTRISSCGKSAGQ